MTILSVLALAANLLAPGEKFVDSEVIVPSVGGVAYRTSIVYIFVGEDYAGKTVFARSAKYLADRLQQWQFPEENVRIVPARSAGEVEAALSEAKDYATEKDRVIVAYIGHGESSPKGPVLKLRLTGSDISASHFAALAKQVRARHRMVLVDSCRSGDLSSVLGGVSGLVTGPEAFAHPSSFAFLSSAPSKDAVTGAVRTRFVEAFVQAAEKAEKTSIGRGVYVGDVVGQLQEKVPDARFGSLDGQACQMLLDPLPGSREMAGVPQETYDDKQAQEVEDAIKNLRAAIRKSDSASERANLYLQLGVALRKRHDFSLRKTSLQEAVENLRDIPSLNPKLELDRQWALAIALSDLGNLGNFRENRLRAVDVWRDILRTDDAKRNQSTWAWATMNLGVCYRSLSEIEDNAGNLRLAIESYKNALRVRTQNDQPEDWAMVTMNLGVAHAYLADIERPVENLKLAIAAYQGALRVFRDRALTSAYAQASMNLGNAYDMLSTFEEKAENLQRAIIAYTESMASFSKEQAYERATVNLNLGVAYWHLADVQDKSKNLKRSTDLYKKAESVFNEKDLPYEWAVTVMNLGRAYMGLSYVEDKVGNLRLAIAAFRDAERGYLKVGFVESAADARDLRLLLEGILAGG